MNKIQATEYTEHTEMNLVFNFYQVEPTGGRGFIEKRCFFSVDSVANDFS